jgi:hypothetical protein
MKYGYVYKLTQNNSKELLKFNSANSLTKKERINLQKIHQIARLVYPDSTVSRSMIPRIIYWLKTMK